MKSRLAKEEMLIDLAFKGVGELRSRLGVDETSYMRIAGSAHADGRAYVLYGALDEVEKTAIQVMRLRELLDGDHEDKEGADVHSRLVREHVVEEQHARARRLTETLVSLILCSTTNEHEYYRHQVLLMELEGYLWANQELGDFHGAPSANVNSSIRRLADEVQRLEKRIDLSRAWYKKNAKPLDIKKPRVEASSMRTRIKKALPLATALEKLCLGTTYAQGFGRLSRTSHFSPTAGRISTDTELPGNTVHLELLALCVMRRCYELMDRPKVRIAEQIDRVLTGNDEPTRLVQLLTVREIMVGDFVVAAGHLAEVLEVVTSEFGYRSYFVEFLSGSPIRDIPKDWLPAQYVTKLFERERLVEGVRSAMASVRSSEEAANSLQSMAHAELQSALRRSVLAAWERGLGKHVLNLSGAQRNASAPSCAVTVFADGASRRNPGRSAIGVVILDAAGATIKVIARCIGEATNNVAEWQALIAGLEAALDIRATAVHIRMDSELVVRQIQGIYRVRDEKLIPLAHRARELLEGFERYDIRHIPRDENADADALANRALDEGG